MVQIAIAEREIQTSVPMTEPTDTMSGPPEASRSERLIAISIFGLSFLYLCLLRRATWIDLDEGIILQGAQRILDGQVLYRDFFSFFTPGSYYLLALVFRVFGDSYVVAHTLLAVVGAAFSPITYALSRRVCGRQASLLVTGLMTITALPLRFVVLHNWDSTLGACLTLYCAVRLLETCSTRWAFAAASFASITVLFEQSKGAGLLLGLGVGFLIIALYGQEPNVFNRRHLTAIALGLAWPLLITFAYFGSQHAFGAMLRSWFWPLQHYSTANRVPYGYGNLPEETQYQLFHTGSWAMRLVIRLVFAPRFWIPYLPLFGVALLLRLALQNRRGIQVNAHWSYYVLVSAVISGLLPTVIAVRADYIHFFFLQPIFFLLIAWLLDGKQIRSSFIRRQAPAVGFFLCISLLAMGAQGFIFQAPSREKVLTRRGLVAMGTKDMVVDYIQAHVPPGESILFYPYMATYYYLTKTYSPTRFEFSQPGMHTYEQMQVMLAEFSAHPTRFVVYEPAFPDHIHDSWPNTPAEALARDPLGSYIAHNYRPCVTLTSSTNWHFLFMTRRDLACPSDLPNERVNYQ
jgi:dolichyl-phosphate-mannose-protein mannosyltransferase